MHLDFVPGGLSQLSSNNYSPWYGKDEYNCTIHRIIQGEWYSRYVRMHEIDNNLWMIMYMS